MKSGQKNIKSQSTVTIRKVSAKKLIVKEEKKEIDINFDSKKYWQNRYKKGGNSGKGSYGFLAEYKKNFINKFIKNNSIKSLVEYGCGDCNQLFFIECENILGYDISCKSIELCKKKLPKMNFYCGEDNKSSDEKIELFLSLDVIFHLVEDKNYKDYIAKIIEFDCPLLIIYSSDFEDDGSSPIHVKHRKFTNDSDLNKNYELIKKVSNEYPSMDENEGSFSNWFIYKKINYDINVNI